MKQSFIREHLLIVCGEAGIKEAETGGAALHDKPQSGQICAAVMPASTGLID
jgi:hypothetical protein